MTTTPTDSGARRPVGRAREIVTTVLDIVGLIAVPFGAGMVAGLGVGLIVGGVAMLVTSWRVAR